MYKFPISIPQNLREIIMLLPLSIMAVPLIEIFLGLERLTVTGILRRSHLPYRDIKDLTPTRISETLEIFVSDKTGATTLRDEEHPANVTADKNITAANIAGLNIRIPIT